MKAAYSNYHGRLMKFINLSIITCIVILSTACVFTPKVVENQPYSHECKMQTRKLYLNQEKTERINCDSNGSTDDILFCAVMETAVIPAGSLIVSGSIVMLGNTIHWLEYHGSCEKGFVSKKLNKYKKNMAKKS